ncbi:MAG: hypothetical protein ACPHK8_06260 [Thermoplasmatota archaeon]
MKVIVLLVATVLLLAGCVEQNETDDVSLPLEEEPGVVSEKILNVSQDKHSSVLTQISSPVSFTGFQGANCAVFNKGISRIDEGNLTVEWSGPLNEELELVASSNPARFVQGSSPLTLDLAGLEPGVLELRFLLQTIGYGVMHEVDFEMSWNFTHDGRENHVWSEADCRIRHN